MISREPYIPINSVRVFPLEISPFVFILVVCTFTSEDISLNVYSLILCNDNNVSVITFSIDFSNTSKSLILLIFRL